MDRGLLPECSSRRPDGTRRHGGPGQCEARQSRRGGPGGESAPKLMAADCISSLRRRKFSAGMSPGLAREDPCAGGHPLRVSDELLRVAIVKSESDASRPPADAFICFLILEHQSRARECQQAPLLFWGGFQMLHLLY
uniref:Uncharacterized protein n=1 Tax=Pipistrellus kuhlii TaxID=59472 RepID=A0A7J7S099_PIPKU|nr:hypothetical protein mPipKuh1_010205 [Pipistrellus kuhlii]